MQKIKNKQRNVKLATKRGERNLKRNQHRLSAQYKELCEKIRNKRKEKQKSKAA
jgi:hypothetical protein